MDGFELDQSYSDTESFSGCGGVGRKGHQFGVSSIPNVLGAPEFERLSRSFDSRSASYYRFSKRTFDIFLGIFALLVTATIGPVPVAIIAVAVMIDTKGSFLHNRKRVGRLGRFFRIYKVRTMVVDVDNAENYLSDEQMAQWGHERKVDNDPRITWLGCLLRKTSVDENSNFINVPRGEMSIIEPYAITEDELAWFGSNIAEFLSAPAKITGWCRATARDDNSFESCERQTIELEYVRNTDFSVGTKNFLQTFRVLFHDGTGK